MNYLLKRKSPDDFNRKMPEKQQPMARRNKCRFKWWREKALNNLLICWTRDIQCQVGNISAKLLCPTQAVKKTHLKEYGLIMVIVKIPQNIETLTLFFVHIAHPYSLGKKNYVLMRAAAEVKKMCEVNSHGDETVDERKNTKASIFLLLHHLSFFPSSSSSFLHTSGYLISLSLLSPFLFSFCSSVLTTLWIAGSGV